MNGSGEITGPAATRVPVPGPDVPIEIASGRVQGKASSMEDIVNKAWQKGQVAQQPTAPESNGQPIRESSDTATVLNAMGTHTESLTDEEKRRKTLEEPMAAQLAGLRQAEITGKDGQAGTESTGLATTTTTEVKTGDRIDQAAIPATENLSAAPTAAPIIEAQSTDALLKNETANFLNSIGEHTTHPSILEAQVKSNQELYKGFKEKLDKNKVRYADIGGVLILPSAIPSPDGSQQTMIGFDEKIGPIKFGARFEGIIQARIRQSPEAQKEIGEAIKKINLDRLPELQMKEGLREITGEVDESKQQYELLIWDRTWFRPMPVETKPDNALIDSAIKSGIDYSAKLADEEKKWADARAKSEAYHNGVKTVLSKY